MFYETYTNHAPVSNSFFKKWIVMLVVCAAFLLSITGLLIKSLLALLRVTSSIILNGDCVKIGNDIFTFSEIKQIKTIYLDSVFYECFYGASIILSNGETRFLLGEQFYKNDSILLKELESINQHYFSTSESVASLGTQNSNAADTDINTSLPLEKNHSEGKINEVQPINVGKQKEEYFDFNIFTSITHLLLLAIFIISLSTAFKHIGSPGIVSFSLVLAVIIYYLVAQDSFHFVLDGHTLQIKNKLLFGYSKTFILTDIKGVATYTKGLGRSSRYGIRIISKDYKSTFFASNTLPTKKWKKLRETLRNNGIVVIDQWET